MHKRRQLAEMVALTIAILVSPNATTKGGGPHVLLFLFMPFPSNTVHIGYSDWPPSRGLRSL